MRPCLDCDEPCVTILCYDCTILAIRAKGNEETFKDCCKRELERYPDINVNPKKEGKPRRTAHGPRHRASMTKDEIRNSWIT